MLQTLQAIKICGLIFVFIGPRNSVIWVLLPTLLSSSLAPWSCGYSPDSKVTPRTSQQTTNNRKETTASRKPNHCMSQARCLFLPFLYVTTENHTSRTTPYTKRTLSYNESHAENEEEHRILCNDLFQPHPHWSLHVQPQDTFQFLSSLLSRLLSPPFNTRVRGLAWSETLSQSEAGRVCRGFGQSLILIKPPFYSREPQLS